VCLRLTEASEADDGFLGWKDEGKWSSLIDGFGECHAPTTCYHP
jgi:hypothetical protein